MARVNVFTSLGLSIFGTAALTGCVSEEKYNASKMQSAQYAEQLAAAQSNVNSVTAQNEVFKQQLQLIRNSGDNQAALLVNQAATISELRTALADAQSRYDQAVRQVGQAGAGALPVQLTNELSSFAAQNPDLVDFDDKRGVVKFKSDVTFDPGSAVVKEQAKAAITRLGSILNGPVASQYDLMVVGHTDAQPVSNPATVKAGHLDNWYLSAHRAITVSKELQRQGVNAGRLEVAGYADQRPVDPAGTKEAMARNRRVEVLVLPTSGKATAPAPIPTPAPTPVPAAGRTGGLNKDVIVEPPPPRPQINK